MCTRFYPVNGSNDGLLGYRSLNNMDEARHSRAMAPGVTRAGALRKLKSGAGLRRRKRNISSDGRVTEAFMMLHRQKWMNRIAIVPLRGICRISIGG